MRVGDTADVGVRWRTLIWGEPWSTGRGGARLAAPSAVEVTCGRGSCRGRPSSASERSSSRWSSASASSAEAAFWRKSRRVRQRDPSSSFWARGCRTEAGRSTLCSCARCSLCGSCRQRLCNGCARPRCLHTGLVGCLGRCGRIGGLPAVPVRHATPSRPLLCVLVRRPCAVLCKLVLLLHC